MFSISDSGRLKYLFFYQAKLGMKVTVSDSKYNLYKKKKRKPNQTKYKQTYFVEEKNILLHGHFGFGFLKKKLLMKEYRSFHLW